MVVELDVLAAVDIEAITTGCSEGEVEERGERFSSDRQGLVLVLNNVSSTPRGENECVDC